ncbi:predicted protein [Sclerotinia sclerotiorum 1980 UF-70]|uniref:Uncharacterized protein n=2 Tax=Sclerotinia sclerotiorum (strain ATCC 18683 / 1980 / Ss-1) TaxID=665079 RepID=A0A1D9Q0B0_SCLS1|nr:predicted protein [Sclerotinia sclerotiorum 1980 UF-70]APA08408.1 hypothetical protein sscle_03g031780 [Sclerotinia sclerotiorum 1980 UF-70]EDN98496.1 predicted protein [Sclerotinia sclerotiorum 1980 UF-70]
MASHSKYEKLQSSDIDSEPEKRRLPPESKNCSHKNYFMYPFVFIFIASNIFTWFLSSWHSRGNQTVINDGLSQYAGLARDYPIALGKDSPYTDSNETLRNEVWEAINIDAGMIAVPDGFVSDKNLHPSQRFVWDKSKSVYLLNGHHTLHCVRAVYISLMEFWQERPQSRRWEHVIHCVDQLRQEALCNADDTPRYSTSDNIPVSGMGQVRMCRSWEKLEQWAKQYNSCYRYVNQTASYKDFPQIERFIWCPEGSPYAAAVEEVFGKIDSSDWESYH